MPDMYLTHWYASNPGAKHQGRGLGHVNVSMSILSSLCIFLSNSIYKSHLKSPPRGHNSLHQDGKHIGLKPGISPTHWYASHPGAACQGRSTGHIYVNISISSFSVYFHHTEYVNLIITAPPRGYQGLNQEWRHIHLKPDISPTLWYASQPGSHTQDRSSPYVNVSLSIFIYHNYF